MENCGVDDGFRISISIDSRLDYVWGVRKALAAIFNSLAIDEQESFLIQLAVSELINNIIEHGYEDRPGKIDVSLSAYKSELEIFIADDAPPIPVEKLNELTARDLVEPTDQWPDRGHGMAIIRKTMDEVKFSRAGDRNQVVLSKRLTFKLPSSI